MSIFFRFLVVGSLGFLIDAGLTSLLIRVDVSPFLARIPAIAFAMLFTWLVNRRFTFAVKEERSGREAIKYALVAFATAAFNYIVYYVLVAQGVVVAVAVALATGAQVALSFYGYRHFAFAERGRKEEA